MNCTKETCFLYNSDCKNEDYFIDGKTFFSLSVSSAMENMGVGVETQVPFNPFFIFF